MRIRSVKPSFWADAKIADLAEPTRLFYIGLWGYADDAGWLRWDAREVSRELYGYEAPRRREARTARMFSELIAAKRVVLYPCGHAELPHLVEHQHLAGTTKQVRTVFNEHLKGCVSRTPPQVPADPRESPQVPATVSKGKGMVSEGEDRKGLTEFRLKVERPA